MATIEHQKLLSPAEVALRLGISRPSVYRKIERGEIPAVRLGGPGSSAPLRVPERALEAWLYSDPGEAA